MSNQVAKIESGDVADFEAPPTEREAELALTGADLPEADVARVRDRSVYGRFVGSRIAGYIVGTGEWNLGKIEKVIAAMEKILDDEKAPMQLKINAAETIKNLSGTAAAWAAVQLKAAEILGRGSKNRQRQSNAPRSITGISVSANNVQINGK